MKLFFYSNIGKNEIIIIIIVPMTKYILPYKLTQVGNKTS